MKSGSIQLTRFRWPGPGTVVKLRAAARFRNQQVGSISGESLSRRRPYVWTGAGAFGWKENGQYRRDRLWRATISSITASRVRWCTPELNQRGLTVATTRYALLKNTFGSKMSPQSCRYGSLLRTKGPKIQLKLVNVKNSSPAQKGRFVG